jgi:DNA polymerase-3 subunit delta
MKLSGKAAQSFLTSPDNALWAVLIFGEDEGLNAEASLTLLKAWSRSGGPLDVTSLDDDLLRKDPSAFYDALEAVSLLGDARAIRLRVSGDKSAALIASVIQSGDKEPNRFAARLIVEAGALTTKSKLRTAFEGAKRATALQLFADAVQDIAAMTRRAVEAEGAAISEDALAAFTGDLPGHRALASREIEKLALFARGLDRPVNAEDVRALAATDLEHATAETIRAVLDGRAADANTLLDRLEAAGTTGITLLRALEFEALRLIDAGQRVSAGDASPGMKLRPPVWQSDWPAYQKLIAKWPGRRALRILARVHEAETDAKKSSAAAPVIVRMLMNDVLKAGGAKPSR